MSEADFKRMLEHTDTFVHSLIDPDRHMAGYPANGFPTTVSRQTISVKGNTYSSDGDVSLYISNDGLAPLCVSNRASLNVPTGSADSLTLVQPVSASAGTEYIVEPIQYGSNYVLFSAPVTFTGTPTLPGYHFSVSNVGLTVIFTHGIGMVGKIDWWHRNAGGFITNVTNAVAAQNSSLNISIPSGSTAFGGSFSITQANGQPITFCTAPNPGSVLDFGNHSAFTRRYAIPDRSRMDIERARLLGNKVHLKYDGDNYQNGGALACAQFPPGTNPSQYPGDSTYDQIISAQIPLAHIGHFKDGCVARFVQPTAHDYALVSLPKRFGENGYTVMNFRSVSVSPQPYSITCVVTVEFTSHLQFIPRFKHAYAEEQIVLDAIALLNITQMISDNPIHELVSSLWDKVKKNAGRALTVGEQWFKIAAIVAPLVL